MQINAIVQALILMVCIAHAFCDCYRERSGCRDLGNKRRYRLGEIWKPSQDQCYTCKCRRIKVTAKSCKVAVDEKRIVVVKKSALPAKFAVDNNEPKETSIRITPRQAKTKKCPPIRAPTYNWHTGTFEDVTYKTVNYFYYKRVAVCCNRSLTYSFVHPSCKVVKVGKCDAKVVQKRNPKRLCNAPMSLVG